MNKERKEKLQNLQIEREWWINLGLKTVSPVLKETYNQKIRQVKTQMALVNKLDDSEKNIHVIWIGKPPKGEFDNLKLWAKHNPDYKIHIWTDYTHVLAHQFNTIMANNSKIKTDTALDNYQLEANYKDKFYNKYQLKNLKKTFDENVKQFFLKNGTGHDLIDKWIKDAKETFLQEQEDIKKYTPNEVILHDVNQEKDSIFPSKKYYNGYLKMLEHLHLCAGASDYLRYAVLDKFGGVYLDTDVAMRFNLKDITNNQEVLKLINQIECVEYLKNNKIEVILNHIILLKNMDKLNDEKLKDFANKWENIFVGSSDKNLPIFKEISEKIKDMNLNLTPEMKLDNFPLDNVFAIAFHVTSKTNLGNAFIFSKKDSKFLQTVMQGIELTDEKLKKIEIDTYTKLINKNSMVLYHTGPTNILTTLLIEDENHFYLDSKNGYQMITLENINGYNSTWFNYNPNQNTIKDQSLLKSFFYTYPGEIINFNQLKEKFQNVVYKEKEKTNDFELIGH